MISHEKFQKGRGRAYLAGIRYFCADCRMKFVARWIFWRIGSSQAFEAIG